MEVCTVEIKLKVEAEISTKVLNPEILHNVDGTRKNSGRGANSIRRQKSIVTLVN